MFYFFDMTDLNGGKVKFFIKELYISVSWKNIITILESLFYSIVKHITGAVTDDGT